jgi:hypothetical protein
MQAYNNGNKAQGDTYLKYASGYYAESNNATASANQFKAAIPAYVLPAAAVGGPGADLAFNVELGGGLYAIVGGNFEVKANINISKREFSITEAEGALGLGVGYKVKVGFEPLKEKLGAVVPMEPLETFGSGQANQTGAISTKFSAEAAGPFFTVTALELRAVVQSPLNGVPATDKNFGGFTEAKVIELKAAPALNAAANVKWDIFNTSYKMAPPKK